MPDPMRQLLLSDLLPIVEEPRGRSLGLPIDKGNSEAFELLDAYFADYDPKAEASSNRVHAESQRRRRDRSFASYWELTRRR